MADCTCKVTRQPDGTHRRTRAGWSMGPHHEATCPMFFDPLTAEPKVDTKNVCDRTPGEGSCVLCADAYNCHWR
jgi:hypothetical protein